MTTGIKPDSKPCANPVPNSIGCDAIFCTHLEFGGFLMDASPGELTIDGSGLHLSGDTAVSVEFSTIRSVRMFRHKCLCRMIEIIHDGGTLFVAPIRGIFFWGKLAWINFFKAGELFQRLSGEVCRVHTP